MTKLKLGITSRATSSCLIIVILCKMLFVAALLLVRKFQLHLRRKKLDNTCKWFPARYQTPLLLTPGACDCPCAGAGWLTLLCFFNTTGFRSLRKKCVQAFSLVISYVCFF